MFTTYKNFKNYIQRHEILRLKFVVKLDPWTCVNTGCSLYPRKFGDN